MKTKKELIGFVHILKGWTLAHNPELSSEMSDYWEDLIAKLEGLKND